ncbi:MAG: DUF4124 domain-containing protein [Betaproteobacteria bacterium]|nr:DUF4124 domain-containing protein [Betaproteobacteria bacterium]MCL2885195.1 DUF4124 domain-containing protein [Betaproteobacteria bacterium]
MSKRLLPLLALLLAPLAAAMGEFYCCQDANGQSICGDTLPERCRGHAYRILDRNGNIIKEIAPPLTPEQKAEQAMEARRRKLEEAAAREQRRLDNALLDTYATPQDIDFAQQKAENDVDLAIRNAQEVLAEAQDKRQKLAEEAEFYQKKSMPSELQNDLRATDHEIKVQQELIAVKKREKAAIRAKYEADRKRYLELTGRRSTGATITPPNSSATAR